MSRIRRTSLGFVITVACLVGPAEAAAADAAGCAVTYKRAVDWDVVFTADVTITNTGTEPLAGWTFSFPLDERAEVTSFRHAELISGVSPVIARNMPHNGAVPSLGHVDIWFQVVGTDVADPTEFSVNGLGCTVVP